MPKRIIVSIIIAVIITAVVLSVHRATRVQVVSATCENLTETIAATGQLRAVMDSDIVSETAGVVDHVYAREGMQVVPGQVLLTLVSVKAQNQLDRAETALFAAQQELLRVNSPTPTEITAEDQVELRQVHETNAARLKLAQDRLIQAQRGSSPERNRVQANLKRAEITGMQADAELKRCEELFVKDAIGRSELEHAQSRAKDANSAIQTSREKYNASMAPVNERDVQAAKAQLAQAEAQFKASSSTPLHSRSTSKPYPPELVTLAKRRLSRAITDVSAAKTEIKRCTVVAPFGGIVVKSNAQSGADVKSGDILLKIADATTLEVIVEVERTNLSKLKTGQIAQVVSPRSREVSWEAKLTRITPSMNRRRNLVTLHLTPAWIPSFCKPEMTVELSLTTKHLDDAITIPDSAVIEGTNCASVFTISKGRIKRSDVKVLAHSAQRTALAGIATGTNVVLNATSVADGQQVTPVLVKP